MFNCFKILSFIYWDPPREAFVIPYIDFAIYWYSLFFALGFLCAYFLFIREIQSYLLRSNLNYEKNQIKSLAYKFTDKLAWYIFFGMLIGARLGHVIFYEFDYFVHHPLEIFLTRKGGLASHGGAIGVLIALFLFFKYAKKPFQIDWKKVLDLVTIQVALVGAFIRIGNFFNQEILGTKSTMPWAVVFGHPADPFVTYPCHPVQLYEALFYLLVFICLLSLSHSTRYKLKNGFITGLFFVSVFTFRFFIEFLKMPQEIHQEHFLQMGQLLSLPFIALGIYFLCLKEKYNTI